MSRQRLYSPQFDLFIPYVADVPLRDQRETMERPFFSLSKNKRIKPIDYVRKKVQKAADKNVDKCARKLYH